MRLFICTGLALTLLGCGGSSEGGVKGAKGDTPVRYIICGQGETNCFLAARFDDLDGWRQYDEHPDHDRVRVEAVRPHIAERAAVQFSD
jgi:hypothetical protein